MTTLETIKCRHTLRDFADRTVPQDIIEEALKAGLRAPSYNHQKEWDFVLVRDPAQRRALIQGGRLGGDTVTRDDLQGLEPLAQDMYLDAIPKQARMILTASHVLVMVYTPKTPVAQSMVVSDVNCLAAVWCCIENILLALAAHDVFGTTLVPGDTVGIKSALGIPQELEVATLLPFGYAAEDARIIPQKQASLQDRLHEDKW